MAKYSSKPVVVNYSAEAVSDKFSDLTTLQQYLDKLPDAERSKIGDVALTADSITIKTPQMGNITLQVTERTPSRVCFSAVGSPLPINLAIDIKPIDSASSEITSSMDVEIPVFLKPMIGGTLQKAVDQFGEMIHRIL